LSIRKIRLSKTETTLESPSKFAAELDTTRTIPTTDSQVPGLTNRD
jgi:hypothetical protein